jgi:glycosyltransferase involved in cell wall biosynthesis
MAGCLHIFLTVARQESRFLREAASLIASGQCGEVRLAAKWEPGLAEREALAPGVDVWRVKLRTLGLPRSLPWQLLKHFEWKARIVGEALRTRPSLLVAHSLAALPVAVACKRRAGARLVYDAHELETERNGVRGIRQKLDRWAERRLIRHCDAVVVVSDSIADWYAQKYGIARPVVVRNVPEVPAAGLPAADPALWRKQFNIPADHMVFIYQGGLFPGRRIEQLIRVFAQAKPDRHVVFMGYGELEGVVQAATAKHANIHFAPAVAPADVLRHTAGADVGLVGVANVCLSYYYSLPNKLFEFLLAGVPAMMPAFPEMVRTAEATGCGWTVGEEDGDWLAFVNALDWAAINTAKARTRAAAGTFTWSQEADKFLAACAGARNP